jgi:hypothetical protein
VDWTNTIKEYKADMQETGLRTVFLTEELTDKVEETQAAFKIAAENLTEKN